MNDDLRRTRRRFLQSTGLGMVAGAGGLRQAVAVAARTGDGGLLAPRLAHHPPRANRLIMLFYTGGFSQVDTFDYKPELQANHEKKVSAEELFYKFEGKLLASPYQFEQAGECGMMISELFPYLKTVADDLCVIRTLHTDILEHFEATLAMHTGSATFTMPSFGSWISYGLGTFNQNLPSHLVLCKHTPYAGSQNWDNGFLPPQHQGVRIIPGNSPIPNIQLASRSIKLQQLEQLMLRDINEAHARLRPEDLQLKARTDTFNTAQGMMREAPDLFDLSSESSETLKMYGITPGDNQSFGYQCLVARRMTERGVRVIEVIDTGSAKANWDAHGNIHDHRRNAKWVDQGTAALIRDLKQRGLFEDTLVMICTEFGRTPWYQDKAKNPGRNHWHRAFTCLLVGAGVKSGMTYGETNEWGSEVASDPCHVHDYHATILHLLGLDHTRLTYRYSGRDFRLTDVYGNVVQSILS